MKDDIKLYCVYHDKELLTDFVNIKPWIKDYYKPLVETEWFKPYYTKNNDTKLNSLQQFLCEFTALYYIYEKQLKSQYIGVCHYGRQYLRTVVENNMYKKPITLYTDIYCNTLNNRFEIYDYFLYDDFMEYVKTNYNETTYEYNLFIKNEFSHNFWNACMCFICEWDIFCKMMEFVVGFIEYVDNKYSLNWDYVLYRKFIEDKFINVKDWEHLPKSEWYVNNPPTNKYRVYAYVIEFIIGFYLYNYNK